MGHQRRRYREQEIAPKRIPPEAWYSLPAVTRERISRDYYDGHDELVTPGVTYIGAIQDSLRAAGRAAAAARFMRAMQEWFDAQESLEPELPVNYPLWRVGPTLPIGSPGAVDPPSVAGIDDGPLGQHR